LNGFVVDFFVNKKAKSYPHHYIITREGSRSILAWGHCPTIRDCEAEARKAIEQLERRNAKRG
jgi:hypothetical protein